MSKSNYLENGVLSLIFLNQAISAIGDASGLQPSATEGSLYISLHTADPGEAGLQNANECAYTGYARVAVARNTGGWTVTGNGVVNAADITFPECTAGSETATHWGIGTEVSGATELLYSGPVDASLAISSGTIPKFPAGALSGTEE